MVRIEASAQPFRGIDSGSSREMAVGVSDAKLLQSRYNCVICRAEAEGSWSLNSCCQFADSVVGPCAWYKAATGDFSHSEIHWLSTNELLILTISKSTAG